MQMQTKQSNYYAEPAWCSVCCLFNNKYLPIADRVFLNYSFEFLVSYAETSIMFK